jgi:hypothetical protein
MRAVYSEIQIALSYAGKSVEYLTACGGVKTVRAVVVFFFIVDWL